MSDARQSRTRGTTWFVGATASSNCFITFAKDADSGALHKVIAGYHQFHAANAAVEETVRASGMAVRDDSGTYWAERMNGGKLGDRRAGVVWHMQGSGKNYPPDLQAEAVKAVLAQAELLCADWSYDQSR